MAPLASIPAFENGCTVQVTDPGSEHHGRRGSVRTTHGHGDTVTEWYYDLLFDDERSLLGDTARLPETMLAAVTAD